MIGRENAFVNGGRARRKLWRKFSHLKDSNLWMCNITTNRTVYGGEDVNTLLRIDIDLFAVFFLSIVLVLAYRRLDHEDSFNRLFFRGSLTVMLMTVFEAATCVLNHHPELWMRTLSTVLHFFLFTVTPLMTCYWYLLADTLTLHGSLRDMKMRWPYLLPIVIVLVITVLSPIWHFVFYIDASGVYHRGPLFLVVVAISYGYLLWGFLLLFKRRKSLTGIDFVFLTLFCLMPLVGGLIQSMVYGPLLMWPSSACALAILYLYLQERMVHTDYLTGAWSRLSFEQYMEHRLHSEERQPFGVVYLDIDNLKSINDEYGHREGDEAIRAATAAVKGSLRKGDAVARLGGDEFAVLLNTSDHESLNAVVARIGSAIAQYNEFSGKPYQLSLSIGADVFPVETGDTVEDIVSQVDQLMYLNKRSKKQRASAESVVGEAGRRGEDFDP